MLTEKQIAVVKELLYKKICNDMSNNIVIFDIKSNKINYNRITEYFTQIGLRSIKINYDNFIVYKHYELLNETLF
jgi:hypothetical protein